MDEVQKEPENQTLEAPPTQSLNQAKHADTQPEKLKKKLPVLKILIAGAVILITLLAFGLIAYLMMGQNKAQENQIAETEITEPTPTPDPTADWKIYEGDGYAFKYPDEWSFEDKESITVFGPISTENHIGKTVDPYITSLVTLEIEVISPGVDIVSYKNIKDTLNPVWEDYQIGNTTGKLVEHLGCVSGDCREILFEKDGKLYTFSEQNNLQELDQILSTFEFTDASETSIFKPKAFNFTINIPEGWYVDNDSESWFRIQNFDPKTAEGREFSLPADLGNTAVAFHKYDYKFIDFDKLKTRIEEDKIISNENTGITTPDVQNENIFDNGKIKYLFQDRINYAHYYLTDSNNNVISIVAFADWKSFKSDIDKIIQNITFTE